MVTCARCGTANPEGFRFCGNCAAPLAPAPAGSDERRKIVTVLFCDVAGSTRLGERLDPETMRAVMARYFTTVRSVFERHGGTVEKFIGDAAMAVFGHPTLHEDDPVRAVRAAADARAALAELNDELQGTWGVRIETRMGVNTGQVVAGDPGGETLVTGDAVNVAARLQTAAAETETLIGEETYRLVRDAVRAEEIAPLAVKGKELSVRAWRLLSVEPEAAGHARRLDSPLVGREREQRLLAEAFRQGVADASCVLFTLLGSAGVGKSRLVHEFLADVRSAATILRGRCLPYGQGITFWPLAEVVKAATGIDESDSPEEAGRKIEALLGADQHASAIAGHVATAIGLAEEVGAGEEIFWAARRFFELIAAKRPLVVVFDDIQWAEPTFLDLLDHVADLSRDAPILLLCVARQELLEARPAWAGGKLHATTLMLQPLPQHDVGQLVDNLLGGGVLSGEVLNRVTEASEGNPLFVEEFVAMLIDDGLLKRDDGRWLTVGDIDRVRVPPTIHSLLAARIDRLGPPERRVIERASVVGKVFWHGAVVELSPEAGRSEVGPSLVGLVRKELVRPDRSDFSGDEAFRFRHLLIRDAAYDGLPKNERVQLHERFAAWLERSAGDRIAEYEEVLGYHLAEAYRYRSELGPLDESAVDLARRASRRLGRAGRRALERSDAVAARKLLERAVALLPTDDHERIELLVDLGEALDDEGAMNEAIAILDEAAAEAERAGLDGLLWRARLRRIWPRISALAEGQFNAGMREATAAIAHFERLGDKRSAAEAWLLAGGISFARGRPSEERAAAIKAKDLAAQLGDDGLELRAITIATSDGLWSDTPLAQVVEDATSALRRARELGRRLPEAASLNVLGRAVAMQGDIDDGRRMVAEARSILLDLGRRNHAAGASHWAAFVELAAGDYARREAVLREGAEELRRLGDRAYLASSYGGLADALRHLGRVEEAAQMAGMAKELSASDDHDAQIQWRVAMAGIAAARGDLDEAQRLGDEALRLVAAAEDGMEMALARMELGEVFLQTRGPDAAADLLRAALSLWERKQATVFIDRVQARLTALDARRALA